VTPCHTAPKRWGRAKATLHESQATGSAHQWQFAIYRATHDDYDESVFPTGLPIGTCQQALDTACGLYLNDPTAWT
jgi:hypothetical protein